MSPTKKQLIFAEFLNRELQEYRIVRSVRLFSELLIELENIRTGYRHRQYQSELRQLQVCYKSINDCFLVR